MIRLAYFCSFVPYMTLKNMGIEMVSDHEIQTDNNNSDLAGNLCSYIKYCERLDFTKIDGIIFTNCCSSTQRLYDYVKYNNPKLFIYLLEIPRNNTDIAYGELFEELIKQYSLALPKKIGNIKMRFKNDILVIASSLHNEYASELKNIFNSYSIDYDDCKSIPRGDLLFNGFTDVSCPRMMNYSEYIKKRISSAGDVICIATRKCDHIMFSYPEIKGICDKYNKRCLLVEEEYDSYISERSRIRFEAFKECLELRQSYE